MSLLDALKLVHDAAVDHSSCTGSELDDAIESVGELITVLEGERKKLRDDLLTMTGTR